MAHLRLFVRDRVVIALVRFSQGGIFGKVQAIAECHRTQGGRILDIQVRLDGEIGGDVGLFDGDIAGPGDEISRVESEIRKLEAGLQAVVLPCLPDQFRPQSGLPHERVVVENGVVVIGMRAK